MIYATYSEFTSRYGTKLTAAEIGSHYLPFASGRLEGLLGACFTVPFSSNNLTAKDLTIDLAYLLILQRSKEPEDHEALSQRITGRIDALSLGTEAMVTTSGEALLASQARQVVWSNTGRYKTVFDLRDSERQEIDPDRLDEEGRA